MRTRCTEAQIAAAFAAGFGGEVRDVRRHGTGHIHDTFVLTWRSGGSTVRLLAQRFNTDVFGAPEQVMQNISRVTDHLRAKLRAAGESDVARRVLRLQSAPNGATFFTHPTGEADGAVATYRAFGFIDGTCAFDVVEAPAQPRHAGRAFGEFTALLEDLPQPALFETIPGFHDTPRRLAALRAAFARDPVGRAAAVQAELARVEAREPLARYCSERALPLGVIHNDAKLSNLLFDAHSGEALCVVDLDTVMPGYALYDFGDLVRTTACLVAEDAEQHGAIDVRMDYVAELARGYLNAQRRKLSEVECEALAVGPKLLCLELGMRFLTDHVSGDTYFAVARPGHNLQRARVQFALVEELERREADVRECVFSVWNERL